MIKCIDNICNIFNNKNKISEYKICHYGDKKVGILVMKYYNLGCIDNYPWNKNNFSLLKNIIKQVIFAIIYAYNIVGFIHEDLHSGNILLKPKRNDIIKYNGKILILEEFEVVIMDFEKSKLDQKDKITDLIRNIDKLFYSIINSNNMILDIYFDRNKLIRLKTFSSTNNFFNEIEKIINEMTI